MTERFEPGHQSMEQTVVTRDDLRTDSSAPVYPVALPRAMCGLRLLKSERGSGLVEYAVITILFMTMLLGIADFSRALYAYHFVSSQAREAARYAMVRGCSTTSTHCPVAATASDIQTFVKNVPLGIDPGKVTVPAPTWTPDHKPGSVVSVEVDYAFNFIFPFVSTNTLNFKSTSQMVITQ
jgi:Flp pilus assembly protein TadG